MGVSGCGKSTVGAALARRLGIRFVEGDGLHPPANVEKMTGGEALGDTDREPWLQAITREIGVAVAAEEGLVVSCSALKKNYRTILRSGDPALVFVHLVVPEEEVRRRMESRDHFMPPELLASQFRDLEEPDEAIVIDATLPVAGIVDRIARALAEPSGSHDRPWWRSPT